MWTKERTEELVGLLASRTPVAECARRFGTSVEKVKAHVFSLPDGFGQVGMGAWSGKMIATLVLGLAARKSVPKMAERLGVPKAAAEAKVHRMRLLLSPAQAPAPVEVKSRHEYVARSAGPQGAEFNPIKASSRRLPPYDRQTILDMKHDSCRWPTGRNSKGMHVFCGREREPGYSFCPAHALQAHTFALGGDEERMRVERRARDVEESAAG